MRYLLAASVAGMIGLAGCSAASGPGGTGAPPKVALTFTVTNGPGTPVIRHWTLNCEPAGGSHPSAATACAALLKMKEPFAPRDPRIACPMILQSNRKLVVTGTWFGTKVHRIVIDGGCDLMLFGKLDKILH